MTLINEDAGKPDKLLTGRANAQDAYFSVFLAQLLFENIVYFKIFLTREMSRISNFGNTIVNIKIDPVGGSTLQDNTVKTGKLEICSEETVGLCTRHSVRQRTLGNDSGSARASHFRAA